MTKNARLEQLARNPRLPTPPAVALQFLDKASRTDCSFAELSRLLSRDPALCGRVLRLINSSLFHPPQPVTSVERALQVMGLNRARSMVLAMALPAAQPGRTAAPVAAFWKASVVGAAAARQLAADLAWPDPENELVAGLLRDLGAYALQHVYPDRYAQVLAADAAALLDRQEELEEEAVGLTHTEVSAFLLEQWRLPEAVVAGVRFHHRPAAAPAAAADRARLLHFATWAAALYANPGVPAVLSGLIRLAHEYYQLTPVRLRDFLAALGSQVAELAGLLNLEVGGQQADILAQSIDALSALAVETNLDNLVVREQKAQAEKERLSVERALRRTEDQLRQAQRMEEVGRLAGGVAHDFNNLLTIINGYSEMILEQAGPHSPLGPLAQEIRKAGNQAATLTQQLLAFSRKQVLQPVPLDINNVLADMTNMLRPLLGSGVALKTDLAPGLGTVRADPSQFQQVILNLAVNARDAMPRGGRLTIRTSDVVLGDTDLAGVPDVRPGVFVQLLVSDTGHGMDEQTLRRIFDPYFTTKEPGKGTGLGLATVYGTVRQSGGHVTVWSRPGEGTTFVIYWPHDASDPAAAASRSAASAPGGSETVLLVEDGDAVRSISRSILKSRGYTVLDTGSSPDAVRIFQDFPGRIDLLVTDVALPRMGGRELADRLRGLAPRLRVLFIGGYHDAAALGNGGVVRATEAVLEKPYGPQALAAKVREILG